MSGALQAWCLCRWVCSDDMRREMEATKAAHQGAGIDIEARVLAAARRKETIRSVGDKAEFYVVMLEWLEEERRVVLDAVHTAGGEAADVLRSFLAVNSYYDTLCDVVGIVAWGNAAVLNDDLRSTRNLALCGSSLLSCAEAHSYASAATLALQARARTHLDFEKYKRKIEEAELEETSKAELQAVALLQAENEEQKKSLAKQLDAVMEEKKSLLLASANHINEMIQVMKESSKASNDAIMNLVGMLDQGTFASGASLDALQQAIEEEDAKSTAREEALNKRLQELEEKQIHDNISEKLSDLQMKELALRKELASIHVGEACDTQDLDRYMLQRNEALLAARKHAQQTREMYLAKKAEVDAKVRELIDRVSGAKSAITEVQLSKEHDEEKTKMKKRLYRSKAADELLKAEAAGSFKRRRSLSILVPSDKETTEKTLDAELAERSHLRAEREYRLAHRQQLEQKERVLLDGSQHLTELKRIENSRVTALRKLTQAVNDVRDTCSTYTPDGKVKCNLNALRNLINAQAARRKRCTDIEDDAFAKKKDIINKMRITATPQVNEKLAVLLKSEERYYDDARSTAASEGEADTMLLEKMDSEPDGIDILAVDNMYKGIAADRREREKLSAAERRALLDEAACAHEQVAEDVHRELRQAVINEVIAEGREDREEEAFLAAQIEVALQDPVKMEELITTANKVGKGDNHYLYNSDALKKEYAEREQQREHLLRRLALEGDRLTRVKMFMKKDEDLNTKNAIFILDKIIDEAEKTLDKQHKEEEEREERIRKAKEEEAKNEQEAQEKPRSEHKPRHSAYSGGDEWMYNLEELEKEFSERKKLRTKEKMSSTSRHEEEKSQVKEQITQITASTEALKGFQADMVNAPIPLMLPDLSQVHTLAKQQMESRELAEMWDNNSSEREASAKLVAEAQQKVWSTREEVMKAVVEARRDIGKMCQQEKEEIEREIHEAEKDEAAMLARREQHKDRPWMCDVNLLEAEYKRREAEREVVVDMILDLHERGGAQCSGVMGKTEAIVIPYLEVTEVLDEQEDDLQVAAADAARKRAAIDYEISESSLTTATTARDELTINRLNSGKVFKKAAAELDAYTNTTTRDWKPRMRNLVKLQVLLSRFSPTERNALLRHAIAELELSETVVKEALPSASMHEVRKIVATFRLAHREVKQDADQRAKQIENESAAIADEEKVALEKESMLLQVRKTSPRPAVRLHDDGEWMYNLDTLEEEFKKREDARRKKRNLAQARADRTRAEGKVWLESTFYKGDWMYDISALIEEEQKWEALQLRQAYDMEDSKKRSRREHLTATYKIEGSEKVELSLREIEEEEVLTKQQRERFEADLAKQHSSISEHVKYMQQRTEQLNALSPLWSPQANKTLEARLACTDRENAYYRLKKESRAFHLAKQHSLQKAKRRFKARKEYLDLTGLINKARNCDAVVAKYRAHTMLVYPLECFGDSNINDLVNLHRSRLAANAKVLTKAIIDAGKAWYDVDICRLRMMKETEAMLARDNFELFTSYDPAAEPVSKPASSTALLYYVAESCAICYGAAMDVATKSLTLAMELGSEDGLLAACNMYERCMENAAESERTLHDIGAVLEAHYQAPAGHKVDTEARTTVQQLYKDAVGMLDSHSCSSIPVSIRIVGLQTTLRDVAPSAMRSTLDAIDEAYVIMEEHKVDHDIFTTIATEREQPSLSEHQNAIIKLDAYKCKVQFLAWIASDKYATIFVNTAGKTASRNCKRCETSAVFERKVVKLKTEVGWHKADTSIRPVIELSMSNTPAPSMPPMLDYDAAMFYKISTADSEFIIMDLIQKEAIRVTNELKSEWAAHWANDAAMADMWVASQAEQARAAKDNNIERLKDRTAAASTLKSNVGRCIEAECRVSIAELKEDVTASMHHENTLIAHVMAAQEDLISCWVQEVRGWNTGIDTSDIAHVTAQHPRLLRRVWPETCLELLDTLAGDTSVDELAQSMLQIRFSLMTGHGTGYVCDSALHGVDSMMRYYTARVLKTRYMSLDVMPIITMWKAEVHSFSPGEHNAILRGAHEAARWARDALLEESALREEHKSAYPEPLHKQLIEDLYHHALLDAPVVTSSEPRIYTTAKEYFERLAASKLAMTVAAIESGWKDHTEGLAVKALRLVEQRALNHQTARRQHADFESTLHELGTIMEELGQDKVKQTCAGGLAKYLALEGIPDDEADTRLRLDVLEAIKGHMARGDSMWARIKVLTCNELQNCLPERLQHVPLPQAVHNEHLALIRDVTAQGTSFFFDTMTLLHANYEKDMFGSAVTALSHALVSPGSWRLDHHPDAAQYAVAGAVLLVAASVSCSVFAIEEATGRALITLWQVTHDAYVAEEAKSRVASSAGHVESIWKGTANELLAEEDEAWQELVSCHVHELAALTMALEERYLKRLRLAQEAVGAEEWSVRRDMLNQHMWFEVTFDEETKRMSIAAKEELALYLILEELEEAVEEYVQATLASEQKLQIEQFTWLEYCEREGVELMSDLWCTEMCARVVLDAEAQWAWAQHAEQASRDHMILTESNDWQDLVDVMLQGEGSLVLKNSEREGRLAIVLEERGAVAPLIQHGSELKQRWLHYFTLQRLVQLTKDSRRRMLFKKLRDHARQRREHREMIQYALDRGLAEEEEGVRVSIVTREECKFKMLQKSEQHNRILKMGFNNYKRKSSLAPLAPASPVSRQSSSDFGSGSPVSPAVGSWFRRRLSTVLNDSNTWAASPKSVPGLSNESPSPQIKRNSLPAMSPGHRTALPVSYNYWDSYNTYVSKTKSLRCQSASPSKRTRINDWFQK
eukprot:TRINITY_DN4424_c1_g1_i1.p1 TRINITY_DN4424_c1_g1~~TRINITY_DN4424_c1_g1_i1.p1  ORF type:complete len:2809 (+),score=971.31 TRINITY_DN4424_c1_g1_i1:177-8603(+)